MENNTKSMSFVLKIVHLLVGHEFIPERNPFYSAIANRGNIVQIKESCSCGAEKIGEYLVDV